MQKLFNELGAFDQHCYDAYKLSEDILMEHAASGMNMFIREKFDKDSKIIIACGSGHNGADGLALARLLHKDYRVEIFYVKEPKVPMAILQWERAHAIGVKSTIELNKCDVLVDALHGTGFSGLFNSEAKSVIQTINNLDAYKIACDIPSGLQQSGECDPDTFKADTTLSMGALKKSMYSDKAKEFIGEVKVIDLGVSRTLYEGETNWFLLGYEDLKLPHREEQNTHKGTYGHLAVMCGDKPGASIISAMAAFKFGTGLVSLVSSNPPNNLPYSIMHSTSIPQNTKAIACGMGLGDTFSQKELKNILATQIPLVADADLLHMPLIVEILKKENLVITPHPKEFVSILKLTGIADIDLKELQNNRFMYCEKFAQSYPHVTLLLKGSNVIIAHKNKFYINPHGSSALAKGGSGDVLSGLIASLLAQGYNTLDATINASLAHTKLAQSYQGADFSLTPLDLIEGIGKL